MSSVLGAEVAVVRGQECLQSLSSVDCVDSVRHLPVLTCLGGQLLTMRPVPALATLALSLLVCCHQSEGAGENI